MICDECHGCGGLVDDETGEADQCWWCSGTGRVSWWDYFMVWCGVRKDRIAKRLSYTRIGNRYWRRWGKERQARGLVWVHTRFALVALHGRRLERLRVFADAIERGDDLGYAYRIESRLVAEAARALALADPAGRCAEAMAKG